MLVEDIRTIFKRMHANGITNEDGMLEIIGASFVADEPSIFGTPDNNYIAKEIEWYNSKSLNVYDMENPPTIWKNIASSDGYINSNYGWCIYSENNGSQFFNVLNKLRDTPNTRQAIMIYNRPSMHTDAIGRGMSDFMCTNAVTYRMNGNALDAIVQMRSNDAVYGYKNDFAWQDHVLTNLCLKLGCKKGKITWQVASLHVYPRHFHLVDLSKKSDNSLL